MNKIQFVRGNRGSAPSTLSTPSISLRTGTLKTGALRTGAAARQGGGLAVAWEAAEKEKCSCHLFTLFFMYLFFMWNWLS